MLKITVLGLGIITLNFAYAANAATDVSTLSGKTIQICEDGAEWPPYTYYKRVAGKKTDEIVGFSVDVVQAIFKKNNITAHVDLIPWARCQLEVDAGTPYQMALNASYSEERAKKYLLLKSHYSTNSSYFYSKKHYPNGLDIKKLADIKKYKICGIRGYNYTTYGIKSEDIKDNVAGFPQLMEKLNRGQCDLFIEKYEILAGFNVIGEKYLENPDLGNATVPETTPTTFHMIVSRHLPYSQELKEVLETGITDMQNSGELKTLLKQYIP